MNTSPVSSKPFDIAIIGAGVAGLTAAQLLNPTMRVVVIETEKLPGGLAWQLGCKATDVCLYCGVCQGINLKRELGDFSFLPFELVTGQTVLAVRKSDTGYLLTLNNRQLISASLVLIATGIQAFDAQHASRYGYGTLPHVYTGIEIEKNLNTQGLVNFAHYQKIAFIQCVGSRNFKEKRGYCSRVCCRYALRIAEDLSFQFPQIQIDMYYMDLQLLGGKKEKLLSISQERVRLIRHLPYRVESPEGKPVLLFEDDYHVTRAEYDAVILSVGMIPAPGTIMIANIFRLSTDEAGFIKDYSSGETSQERIYVCGTASGPKDIETTIADAKRVAHRILTAYLSQEMNSAPHGSSVSI